MKRMISLILAAVLCLGILGGCGEGTESSSAAPSVPPASSKAPVSSEPPASSQEVSSEAPVSSDAPVSSEVPASSKPAVSPDVPASSAAPKPVPTPSVPPKPPVSVKIPETQAGGHYNNTVPAYYSGNVLVCGDYALEIFGASPSKSYADMVSNFAAKYPKLSVSCALIPKSSAFNPPAKFGNLKAGTKQTISNQYDIQKRFIDGTYQQMSAAVKKADVMGEMTKHNGEYMYYRTDHHWTSLGAYYASAAYCRANGIAPRGLGDYQTVTTTGYIGSMYAFCAKPKPACLKANPDYTVGRLPAVPYQMTYTRDGTVYKGLAINPKAAGYMMFICGDQPYTKIKSEAHTGRKLLVFKESFGNAFVPYMIDYYDEIHVIDIREKTPSVAKLIAEQGITDVLFINNVFAAAGMVKQISSKANS